MTVRWKPLLILSGVFVVIAAIGLLAFSYSMNSGAQDLVELARAAKASGQLNEAVIHYRRALQREPRAAAIHWELAQVQAEQVAGLSGSAREQALADWRGTLVEAATYDRGMLEPRLALLRLALERGEMSEAGRWADEVAALAPEQPEAAYVRGLMAVEADNAQLAKARECLAILEQSQPRLPRADWLAYKIAERTSPAEAAEVLKRVRAAVEPDKLAIPDRLALIRLRALDLGKAEDPEDQLIRADRLRQTIHHLIDRHPMTPLILHQVNVVVEEAQRRLKQLLVARPELANQAKPHLEALEADLTALFETALADGGDNPDLRILQIHADHLMFKGDREGSLQTVKRALALPSAGNPNLSRSVLFLKETAVKAALSDPSDPDRFNKASFYLNDLIASEDPYFQGMGHLFQGAIDLERSGLATGAADRADTEAAKLRDKATVHLREAVARLPKLATAQALYGIALILGNEPALGRQHLANAYELGNLEVRYQLWAAFAMVQTGYPEEAERIAQGLRQGIETRVLPESLRKTILMLEGEIAQARKTPEQLRVAYAKFQEAIRAGQELTPALKVRLAQIQIVLGRTDVGLGMIEDLRKDGRGGAAAEKLAVLTLLEQQRRDEAYQTLDEARRRYPDDEDLVALHSALKIRDGKAEEADALLAEFLETHPASVKIAQTRAQVLADQLNRRHQARALLAETANRSKASGPLAQLALMDLADGDLAAVESHIAEMRKRWPDSAAADLLASQLALVRGDRAEVSRLLAEAVRKDPTNKIALYWKANLDLAGGARDDAQEALNQLASADLTKEIEPGLSLSKAAELSLARAAAREGNLDEALDRLRELIREDENHQGHGRLSRRARWQIVTLHVAKNEVDEAFKQTQAILNDPINPPQPEDRLQAARVFRDLKRPAEAVAQLDLVLKDQPGRIDALVSKALCLHDLQKDHEGAEVIRRAIADHPQAPADLYGMLAAFENLLPPAETRAERIARILDEGLAREPNNPDLIRAKVQSLALAQGPDQAIEYLKQRAAENPDGIANRLLVAALRERQRFDEADQLVSRLRQRQPRDRSLALESIQLAEIRSRQALEQGDLEQADALMETTRERIEEARRAFPEAVEFVEAACELALRQGRPDQAMQLSQQLDKLDPTSMGGPLTRAQVYLEQGQSVLAIEQMEEALKRNPRRLDLRIRMGELLLDLGRPAETLTQADWVLKRVPNHGVATILKARALTALTASAEKAAANRREAIALLSNLVQARPRLVEAAQRLAELHLIEGRRDDAVKVIETTLQANPNDAAAVGQLVQVLTAPLQDQPVGKAELARAEGIAESAAQNDPEGRIALAVSIGYAKSRRLDEAILWADRAVQVERPSTFAWLHLAGLLLSRAELTPDHPQARSGLEQAAHLYAQALARQPNLIEAANNRAWILHRHLGRHQEAMEVVNALTRRIDPSLLPPAFFDTAGSIQEALGRTEEAERSYARGLERLPNEPVLNFHLGRLLANDPSRTQTALEHLRRAQAGQARLKPDMKRELDALLARLGG